MDKGMQFKSKFFKTLWTFSDTKHPTTTAYYAQSTMQVERLNKTKISWLHHYVTKHQQDWDTYVQQLKYSYNAQMHWCMNFRPISTIQSWQPLGPTDLENMTSHWLMW